MSEEEDTRNALRAADGKVLDAQGVLDEIEQHVLDARNLINACLDGSTRTQLLRGDVPMALAMVKQTRQQLDQLHAHLEESVSRGESS